MAAIVFIPSDDLEIPSQRINIDSQVREEIASREAKAGGYYEHSDDEAYHIAESIYENYCEANPGKDVQLLWDRD